MKRVALWICLLSAAASMPGAHGALIFRCSDAAGVVLFTDLPCRNGQLQEIDPTDVATMPGLAPDEVARVARIDAQLLRDGRAQVAQQARDQRAQLHSDATRARQCNAARNGLERIRQIKRRGYTAASAGDLDARQRKYALQADRSCN